MFNFPNFRSWLIFVVFLTILVTSSYAKEGYLIITESQYENDPKLTEFIEFREHLYNVTVTTVSEAGGSTSAIKSYIKNIYNTDGLSYVLFVGKASSGSGGIPYEYDEFPTYHNYGKMDSDNYLDVYVGCFFVRSATDLANIVNKTIYTEKNIDSYPKTQTQFSTFADDSHIKNECGLMRDRYWSKSDYTTSWMIPDLYNDKQYVSALEDQINNNEATFIAYQGHGAVTGWVSGMSNSGISYLTNTEVYPMIWSNACVTGSFQSSSKCFGETWTTAENGASMFYGASNNSYVYQKMLNAGMACGVSMHPEIHTVGQLFAFAKSFVRDSMHITNEPGFEKVVGVDKNHEKMYNLFGDPALEFRKYNEGSPIVEKLNKNSAMVADVRVLAGRKLTVSVKNPGLFKISLFAINGKTIASQLERLDTNAKSVSLGTNLAKGIYYVSIKGSGVNFNKRVSIVK